MKQHPPQQNLNVVHVIHANPEGPIRFLGKEMFHPVEQSMQKGDESATLDILRQNIQRKI